MAPRQKRQDRASAIGLRRSALRRHVRRRAKIDWPRRKAGRLCTHDNKEKIMPDILHRVGINAKPDKVFAALTTIEGLRGWWVSTASGNSEKAGTIDFG